MNADVGSRNEVFGAVWRLLHGIARKQAVRFHGRRRLRHDPRSRT